MSETKLVYQNKTFVFNTEDKNAVIKTKGKFNSVFKGFFIENESAVIIKKLNTNLTSDSKSIERFKREFSYTIHHPNIVQTLAYIEDTNNHYIIRAFAEGNDLKTITSKRKLKTEHVVKYIGDILDALIELHKNQIIHCDIRPANILVDEMKQTAKLIDLGLAKKINDGKERCPFALIYSPPEQLLNRNELVNETSDLYSLGIVFYELLSNKIPFYHSNPEFVMNLQLTQSLSPDKKIPKELFTIIDKATSKYRFTKPPRFYKSEEINLMLKQAQQKRYQYAEEMKNDLMNVC